MTEHIPQCDRFTSVLEKSMVILPYQPEQGSGWTRAEYTTRWMDGCLEKTVRIYSELFGAPTELQSQDIHVVSVHQIPRRRLCGGMQVHAYH